MDIERAMRFERVDAVLAVPWEVVGYERWLRQQPTGPRSYLFAEPQARFDVRNGDHLVAVEGIRVDPLRKGYALSHAAHGFEAKLTGGDPELARKWLSMMDGKTPLVAIKASTGGQLQQLRRLVEVTFGKVAFAPAAVEALEKRVSGIEISRFPGSPYQVVRAYWQNMGSVAAILDDELDALGRSSARDLELLLRRLHVVAVMGEDLDTFYKPASAMSDKQVAPGALLERPSNVLDHDGASYFLSGPRVNASHVGGEPYHRIVYESAGDPEAMAGEREVRDGGRSWGRVVIAAADGDVEAQPWFCPPRPMQVEHWDSLAESLRSALAGRSDRPATLEALASFHWKLVRLHPFHCANQCLAMSVVNAVLRRRFGAGVPHLLLDLFALRLTREAYARVFHGAVDCFSVYGEGPAARLREVAARVARANAVVSRVGQARTAAAAQQEAKHPDARLACILSPSAS